MTGQEVRDILVSKGVYRLHHANSVKTSHGQLRLGGLASRHRIELERLAQTIQFTDDLDKQLGIWNDIFLDTVDIHARASNRNKYGPVMFALHVDILNSLPEGARVLITRSNPSNWNVNMTEDQCYFMDAAQLRLGLDIGDFGQMVVIRTNDGIIPFGNNLQAITLDEPRLQEVAGGEFDRAAGALNAIADASNINIPVQRRQCSMTCRCRPSYAENTTRIPYFFNVP